MAAGGTSWWSRWCATTRRARSWPGSWRGWNAGSGESAEGREVLGAVGRAGTSQVRPGSGFQERDDLVLDDGRDLDRPFVHVHVDLAPDTEVGEVDPRLDREPRPRDQLPLVDRLERVDVAAVAVHLEADAVPGAVQEALAVALGDDVLPGHLVDVRAAQALAAPDRFLEERHGGVARAGDDVPDLAMAVGHFRAEEGHPGDVTPD